MDGEARIDNASLIRVASTTLGVYEFLRIFPTAVNFYVVQRRRKRVTLSLTLFALVQLISISLLVVSNFVFFYPHFTIKSCSRFYLAAPSLKILQIMVSQCIMGVRAYALSQCSKRIGVLLLTLYISVLVLQWMSVLRHPRPAFSPRDGSCLLVAMEHDFGPWVFYAVAIIYDSVVTAICGCYLIKYKRMVTTTFLSKLMDAMIYDGLAYFVGLTATNVLNLIFFRSRKSSVQITAVSVAYVFVWILSQHILLSQYRAHKCLVSRADVNISNRPPRSHLSPTLEANQTTDHIHISNRDESDTTTASIPLSRMKITHALTDNNDPGSLHSLRVTHERTTRESSFPDWIYFADPTRLFTDQWEENDGGMRRSSREW